MKVLTKIKTHKTINQLKSKHKTRYFQMLQTDPNHFNNYKIMLIQKPNLIRRFNQVQCLFVNYAYTFMKFTRFRLLSEIYYK